MQAAAIRIGASLRLPRPFRPRNDKIGGAVLTVSLRGGFRKKADVAIFWQVRFGTPLPQSDSIRSYRNVTGTSFVISIVSAVTAHSTARIWTPFRATWHSVSENAGSLGQLGSNRTISGMASTNSTQAS